MLVDEGKHLSDTREIAVTSLRQDQVPWSTAQYKVYCVELIVLWMEDATKEAFERKKLKYSSLQQRPNS